MSQQIHFITYGNDKFKNSKKRLQEESSNSKWFDTITIYGPENLSEDFKNEFSNILKLPRGNGYWIWKFDIIKQQLTNLAKNDILIYLDAGCTINTYGKTRFNEYIEMLNNSNESIITFKVPFLEKKYTNKELFHIFDLDVDGSIGNSEQILASVLIIKNNEKMMKIIDECINVLRKDHLLVTDTYNTKNQYSEFIENRHDQSILSLVTKKYGSIVLPDETHRAPFGTKNSLKYPFWTTRKRI